VYPNGGCGTVTSSYCDYNCGGYNFVGYNSEQGYNPYTGQSFYYDVQVFTNGSCSVSFPVPCYAYWFWWEYCYYYNYSGFDCNTGCY
jgi:hypothetical protein